jgi:hypothetical protein
MLQGTECIFFIPATRSDLARRRKTAVNLFCPETLTVLSVLFGMMAWAEMPEITGRPVIDTPQLLSGAVILLKKGKPKNIHSVWDLGRKDVKGEGRDAESRDGSWRFSELR